MHTPVDGSSSVGWGDAWPQASNSSLTSSSSLFSPNPFPFPFTPIGGFNQQTHSPQMGNGETQYYPQHPTTTTTSTTTSSSQSYPSSHGGHSSSSQLVLPPIESTLASPNASSDGSSLASSTASSSESTPNSNISEGTHSSSTPNTNNSHYHNDSPPSHQPPPPHPSTHSVHSHSHPPIANRPLTRGQLPRHQLTVKTEDHHTPSNHSHHDSHPSHSHSHSHSHSSAHAHAHDPPPLTAQQRAAALAEQQAHRAAESSGHDDGDDDDDAGGVSDSKMKRGHGASCHQCKTTKDPQFLFFCTNKAEKGVRKRRCRKKYCDSCLKRSYGNDASEIIPSWQCPSCLNVCICAACHRKSNRKESPTITSTSASVPDHSNEPLSMPSSKRSISNSSSRISLSPLTITRASSQDVKLERAAPNTSFVSSPRRIPLAASNKIHSASTNSLSTLDSGASSLGDRSNSLSGVDDLPNLDPYQVHNEELEKLMVGMNMQQRQTFLHEAATLNLSHPGGGVGGGSGMKSHTSNVLNNSSTISPRNGSPRAPKRKIGAPSGPADSPHLHVKYNMQQRVKNQTIGGSDSSDTLGLPPTSQNGGRRSSRTEVPVLSSLLSSTHVHSGSSSPRMFPLSTPSLATHLPDENIIGNGSTGTDANSSSAHVTSDNLSSIPSSVSVTAPPASLELYSPSVHSSFPTVAIGNDGTSSQRMKNEFTQPDYLQWGNAPTLATPNPVSSLLSPLPGSLMLSFPPNPVTPSGGTQMFLGSPNPMAFSGVSATPNGYASSTASSVLFSPNPTSTTSPTSSPNPYGSAMIYPSSYLPPSDEVFAMRQLSIGGSNVVMGGNANDSSFDSSQSHPSHPHHRMASSFTFTVSTDSPSGMWNQDSAAWRQTSANAMVLSTPNPANNQSITA